jgi:DNA-binding NarL/FixJ family response regulator
MEGDEARHRVLVVDDHPIFRRGLVSLLAATPWVAAVHEAADVETAVRIAVTKRVDVVSMDLRLAEDQSGSKTPQGILAIQRLARSRPEARTLVLTMVVDATLVARALSEGARGYFLKSSDPDEVVEALHLIARGGIVLGADVGPRALRPASQDRWPPPFDALTERERRLVQLVSSGRSNAAIARELGVSDKTVRNQISALLVRLSVPDRVAVALMARERGLPTEVGS